MLRPFLLLILNLVTLCVGISPLCDAKELGDPTQADSGMNGTVPQSDTSMGVTTIAYFEAGSYWEFSLLYDAVTAGLTRRGVLNRVQLPRHLIISPGWDADDSVYRAEAKKLMADPAVDLIISMGTVATKALLLENNGKTPIVAIDVADPVGAGFINADTGQGVANLTIQYTRDKWKKVFTLFHQALPFSKLGIMYHNSTEGLSYSNINEAREAARERGFELVEYAGLDKEESLQSCMEGVRELMNKDIDAFYISALNCFDWTKTNPQPVLDTLHHNRIRTFARDGSVQVQHGALMGLSTLDYSPLGEYYADRIARLLSLVPAESPPVQDTYRPKITLNLDTANTLNIDIPLVLLITADELFDSSIAAVRNTTASQ